MIVYKITNLVSYNKQPKDKFYIGITIQELKKRFQHHCKHGKRHITNAIKKYGKNSFDYKVRRIFNNVLKCQKWEYKVLKRLNAVDRDDFLNKSNGDGLIKTKNWLTKKAYNRYSKLTSLGHKGIPETEQTKKRISEGVKKNWKLRKSKKDYKKYCKKISLINSKYNWYTNGKDNLRLKKIRKLFKKKLKKKPFFQ